MNSTDHLNNLATPSRLHAYLQSTPAYDKASPAP